MDVFWTYLKTNALELSGVITGMVCVWYNTRQNVWGWFWSIVSVTIYAVIFLEAKLYADMGLQVIFGLLSVYGLWQWLYGGKGRTVLPVSRVPSRWIPGLVGLCVAGTGSLSWVLHRFTDASIPLVDSFTTAVSLIAQWMLGRKYLENWILWIGVDVIYVGMYIYKNLYWTAFLYVVYLGLSVYGYRDWGKSRGREAEGRG